MYYAEYYEQLCFSMHLPVRQKAEKGAGPAPDSPYQWQHTVLEESISLNKNPCQ